MLKYEEVIIVATIIPMLVQLILTLSHKRPTCINNHLRGHKWKSRNCTELEHTTNQNDNIATLSNYSSNNGGCKQLATVCLRIKYSWNEILGLQLLTLQATVNINCHVCY